MEEKSRLYFEVRKLLDATKDVKDIRESMHKQGYDDEEITEAINEYHKDEKTRDDDKLIKIIERRFHKGDNMHLIIESLIEEGHDRFEVEKAVLRSNLKG